MRTLNVKRLACLLVVLAVVGAGTHFLHGFQVRRNASSLLGQAAEAEKAGHLDDAVEYLDRYLTLVPADWDALERFGVLLDRVADDPAKIRNRARAFAILERVAVHNPADAEVERRLARIAMDPAIRRYSEARSHLDSLLNTKYRNDPELETSLARCLEESKDFDRALQNYRQAKDDGRKQQRPQVETYVRLANLQRRHFKQGDEADKTMQELVEVMTGKDLEGVGRGQKAEAYVARARYRQEQGKLKGAAEDARKARALAPDDPDVLLESAEVTRAFALPENTTDEKAAKAHLAEARGYVEAGLRHAPKNVLLYECLARIDMQGRDPAGAIASLRRGIDVAPNEGRLYWSLAELLLAGNQVDEVKQLSADLRKRGLRPVLLDYLAARVLFAQGQWLEAARGLIQSVPALENSPETLQLGLQARLLVALCYERLGDLDRRYEAYEGLVRADPLSVEGGLGLGATYLAMGKIDKALEAYQEIAPRAPAARPLLARLLVFRTLRLPAGHRQWKEVQRALDQAKEKTPDAPDLALLQAEVYAAQTEFFKAKEVLKEVRDKHPDQVEPRIALANLAERQGEDEQALALFEETEKKLGDSVELRLARASYWTRHDTAKGHPKLAELARGMERWEPEDQERVLRGLAQGFVSVGENKAASRIWAELAARPGHEHDLGARVALFDLAQLEGDEEAMGKWLQQIEDIEGPDGTLWRYARVARLIEQAKKGHKEGHKEVLDEAAALLAEVRKRRPGWARVAAAEAQIWELKGNEDEAIVKYHEALDLGEQRPAVAWQLVRLLTDPNRKRFGEAQRVLEKLPDFVALSGAMQRLGAEVAFANGDFPRAQGYVKSGSLGTSKDYRAHLLIAGIARSNGQPDEAQAELAKAAELAKDTEKPAVWVLQVGFLADTAQREKEDGQTAKAADTLEKAEKVLAGAEKQLEREPVALGKCYEKLGRFEDAQKVYTDALARDGQNVSVLKAAAGLCLLRNQKEDCKKYLLQIAELKGSSSVDSVWARRMIVVLTAVDADYRSSQRALEALDLLNRDRGGNAGPEDAVQNLRTRAIVLAAQKDLGRRLEAIQLLEQVRKDGRLADEDKFLLAQLYDSVGEWRAARELMVSFLASGRATPVFLSRMAASFLRENDVENAGKCLTQLERVVPKAGPTLALKARVLKARGQEAEAVKVMQDYARTVMQDYARTDGADLLGAAATLEQVKPDAAEEVYRAFVDRSKRPESRLVLAAYLGRQNRTAEALAECERVRRDCRPEALAATAIGILYASRPTPQQCQQVEGWLKEAMDRDGPSEALVTALGNLRNLQGNYPAAKSLYRKVLDMPKPTSEALNNLAWLLAFEPGHAEKALDIVNQAVANIGPVPDLLDTRGVAQLRAGRADKAIQDLVAATRQSPSAVNYFHLAEAYLDSKKPAEAAEALQKARALGLKADSLHALERDDYQRVVKAVR
jgi:tetratricopeptide (TPR) repeat protein